MRRPIVTLGSVAASILLVAATGLSTKPAPHALLRVSSASLPSASRAATGTGMSQPIIWWKGQDRTVIAGTSSSVTFKLQNTTGVTETFIITPSCGAYTSCSVAQNQVSFGASQDFVNIVVSFNVPVAQYGATTTVSLTAQSSSSGHSDVGTYNVTATHGPITSVTVTIPFMPENFYPGGGQAHGLAVARDANNLIVTDEAPTWTSSSPSNATLAANGSTVLITPVAQGNATITATVSGISGSAGVTVKPTPAPASMTVSLGLSSLLIGETTQASATVKDNNNETMPNATVTWSSSNTSIATVHSSTGLVTAVAAGSAVITGTASPVSANATVVVSAPPPPPATVYVTPDGGSQTKWPGNHVEIPFVVSAPGAAGQGYSISVSCGGLSNCGATASSVMLGGGSPTLATVYVAFDVPPAAGGNYAISLTASASNGSGTTSDQGQFTVNVIPSPVRSVDVSVPPPVYLGQTRSAVAITRDSAGNTLTGRTVTWSSSNSAVASVNSTSGVVTGVALGNAIITGSSEGYSDTAHVNVKFDSVSTVTVSLAQSTLNVGTTTQGTAVVRGLSQAVLTNRVVRWASNNAAIASVDSISGVVTAVNVGTATITATSEGKSGSASVTDTMPPQPVDKILLSIAAPVLLPNQSTVATAVLKDAYGNTLTGRTVTWTSGNPNRVTVSEGVVSTNASTCNTYNQWGCLGVIPITATSEGKSASVQVSLLTPHTLTISPVGGGSQNAIPNTYQAATFMVHTGSATGPAYVYVSGSCAGAVYGCPGQTSVYVGGYGSTTAVQVPFTASSPGTTGTVSLSYNNGFETITASINYTAVTPSKANVTPKSGTMAAVMGDELYNTARFVVRSTGSVQQSYSIAPNCGNFGWRTAYWWDEGLQQYEEYTIQRCLASASSVTVGGAYPDSAVVTVSYIVNGNTPGVQSTIKLIASGTGVAPDTGKIVATTRALATSVTISTPQNVVPLGDTIRATAQAFTNGVPIPNPPTSWVVSYGSGFSVNSSGLVTGVDTTNGGGGWLYANVDGVLAGKALAVVPRWGFELTPATTSLPTLGTSYSSTTTYMLSNTGGVRERFTVTITCAPNYRDCGRVVDSTRVSTFVDSLEAAQSRVYTVGYTGARANTWATLTFSATLIDTAWTVSANSSGVVARGAPMPPKVIAQNKLVNAGVMHTSTNGAQFRIDNPMVADTVGINYTINCGTFSACPSNNVPIKRDAYTLYASESSDPFRLPFLASVCKSNTVGTISITATATNAAGTSAPVTAVDTITVRDAPIASVEVQFPAPEGTRFVGQTMQASAKLWDACPRAVLAPHTVWWRSSAPFTASVDSVTGLVTPLAPGQVNIIATADNGVIGSRTFTVHADTVHSVAVTLGRSSIGIGDTTKATARVTGQSGLWLPAQGVNWSTNVPAIATVDSFGVVHALMPGTVEIAATAKSSPFPYGFAQLTIFAADTNVLVTPDNGSATVDRALDVARLKFAVKNTSSIPMTFAETVTCTGPAFSGVLCRITKAKLSLSVNETDSVEVEFTPSGTGGASGQLTLTATAGARSDEGVINVTLTSPPAGDSLEVRVQGRNPDATIARDQCLTIAAGDNAAYECGALRLVHSLPTTTTRGKARTPTLIYNSNHAKPGAWIAADVTLRGMKPYKLELTLKMTGRADVKRTIGWDTACAGKRCRVVMPMDALAAGIPTGIHRYTLEVKAIDSTHSFARSDSSEAVIVDRTGSTFGAGWWLDGLEQLVTVDANTMLWIGGDGSTRKYVKSGGSNTYTVNPVMDAPDTLTFIPGSPSKWRRHLSNGTYVEFSNAGQHTQTVGRQADTTLFTWVGSELRSIALPVPPSSTVPRPTYKLVYGTDGSGYTSLRADSAPGINGAKRVTIFTPGTAGAIASITDPDGRTVTFTGGGAGGFITGRSNKLSHLTSFYYDLGGALTTSSLADTSLATMSTYFLAAETRTIGAAATDTSKKPLLLEHLYTYVDGPRTDVADTTRFVLDRYGAPTVVRNALGGQTGISRDSIQPLLVRFVSKPNGLATNAFYSNRGLVDSTVVTNGAAGRAVTKYTWHTQWDEMTSVTAPTGEVTTFTYDAFGNRKTEQPGPSAARKVEYFYDALNRVEYIQPPMNTAAQRHRIIYDTKLGNVYQTVTPKGFISTTHRDGLGRDSVSVTPTDSLQSASLQTVTSYTYDAMSRVLTSRAQGAASSFTLRPGTAPNVAVLDSAVAALVTNAYDYEGNVTRVTRQSIPQMVSQDAYTDYTYDAAHRKKSEMMGPHGAAKKWTYDAAGNVTAWRTGRGLYVRMQYDALGRDTLRVTDSVYQAAYVCSTCATGQSGTGGSVPTFPNWPSLRAQGVTDAGVLIPIDTARFTYDAVGNMLSADNSSAQVRRTYFPDGSIQSDLLRIGRYGPVSHTQTIEGTTVTTWLPTFGAHDYLTTYTYDRSGRRKSMRDYLTESQTYVYDTAATGLLAKTIDRGQEVQFTYDDAGRLTGRSIGGTLIAESRTYDIDGRLTSRSETRNGQLVIGEVLQYDARGKVLRAVTNAGFPEVRDTSTQAYNGLGALIGQERIQPLIIGAVNPTEFWRFDGLGNMIRRHRNPGVGNSSIAPELERRDNYTYRGDQAGLAILDPTPDGRRKDALTPVSTKGDEVEHKFDLSGNETETNVIARIFTGQVNGADQWVSQNIGSSWTRNFYSADEKLRVRQRSSWDADGVLRTVMEEFRYDALGRRVLVRARQNSCQQGSPESCMGTIDRFVWDGNQLLYETRDSAGPTVSGAHLEKTSPTPGRFFGRVHYTHAGGIDEPLIVWKDDQAPFVPHRNWRGSYITGTPIGVVNQNSMDNSVAWAGRYRDVFFGPGVGPTTRPPTDWLGSLMDSKADASGLLYMRNRYYDPKSGRFTQEDPIGLAGGINTYGFVGGDPVNYSDPFGLFPCPGITKVVCALGARIGGAIIARSAALGAVVSAGRALFEGNKPLPTAIARTFERGQYYATTLTADLRVQRVFGGGAEAAGRFLTPSAPSANVARAALQLPVQNTATHIADIVIPEGTTIYTGLVNGSINGATQIFVRNPNILQVVSTRPISPP
jgi:RHS repeat-associated protein